MFVQSKPGPDMTVSLPITITFIDVKATDFKARRKHLDHPA